MDDLVRVESSDVAPSGIVAGGGCEDVDSQPAAAAAAAETSDDLKAEDIVSKDMEESARMTYIKLVEALRESMTTIYQHASEVSLKLAFVHWYGEIMPINALRRGAAQITEWTDVMSVLAAITTQIADRLCGQNVEVTQPRQSSMELCYSIRWPVALSVKHCRADFCRGSHGVVVANAERFAELGWLNKDTWCFNPECTDDVFQALREHMKVLSMAGSALKLAYERFRNSSKNFSDLNKLNEYIFCDIPALSTANFTDFLWRIYQILTVFTNATYSDKRRYSKEEQAMQTKLEAEEALHEMRMLRAAMDKMCAKKEQENRKQQ